MYKQLELTIKGLETHDSWAKWDLPYGYEFQDKDGNVINTNAIKLVKKQAKYPTTYKECCEVIGINRRDVEIDLPQSYQQNLFNLFKLLICRDAYWKIAGEEMGLDKPWEIDWEKSDSGYVYCIVNKCNNIGLTCEWIVTNYILSFPTAEMRDAFYDNFKELIEKCKELL